MTVERAPRPLGLPLRVYVQDDPGDLAPVSSICLGVEHTDVSNRVLFVVNREPWFIRCEIGDLWI